MKKVKKDMSIFYAVLAVSVITGLGLYFIGFTQTGFSPSVSDKGVWCGTNEQRDRIYNHYVNAYQTCLDFINEGEDAKPAFICKLLDECNNRERYPACLEKCNTFREEIKICENLRVKLENLIIECYNTGEKPLPEKLNSCEDNCNDNTGNR